VIIPIDKCPAPYALCLEPRQCPSPDYWAETYSYKGQNKTLSRDPKHNEGIISPVKGKRDPRIGPDALMVMIPSELKYLVSKANAQKVPFHDMSLYNLYQTREETVSRITLSGPFLGAPHATIAMEKLIVLGAKRIWVLGWCGSLQHYLPTGHVVIPTSAASEEGTSAHYPIPDRALESNAKLNTMLEQALKQKGLPFSSGPVWTTDAVYRETLDKVRAYQNQGILAVEMEMSALMTVAIYRSVSMAGLLVVSDELFDLTWRPGFSDPLLKRNSRAAGQILLRLASC
jgi:uridine phosphorylase